MLPRAGNVMGALGLLTALPVNSVFVARQMSGFERDGGAADLVAELAQGERAAWAAAQPVAHNGAGAQVGQTKRAVGATAVTDADHGV